MLYLMRTLCRDFKNHVLSRTETKMIRMLLHLLRTVIGLKMSAYFYCNTIKKDDYLDFFESDKINAFLQDDELLFWNLSLNASEHHGCDVHAHES